MINTASVYISNQTNPYINLSIEKELFDTVNEDEIILYLWQNQNTIVVGRNQNVWKEINVSAFEENGGLIARRLSGGGAVFHDLGNLNFTFISHKCNMNITENVSVIRDACSYFGLDVDLSGRNDLTINGRKFSGNAFYNAEGRSYHHGTIMIDVDYDALSRYLTVDPEKLKSKSVDSVRARVINLKEACDGIVPDVDMMKAALVKAFYEKYGLAITNLHDLNFSFTNLINHEKDSMESSFSIPSGFKEKAIKKYYQQFSSREYILGRHTSFSISFSRRFAWGGVELALNVLNGKIDEIQIYSDAMDYEFVDVICNALTGVAYDFASVSEVLVKTLSNFSATMPFDAIIDGNRNILPDLIQLFKDNI